jgi:hypothetical protein
LQLRAADYVGCQELPGPVHRTALEIHVRNRREKLHLTVGEFGTVQRRQGLPRLDLVAAKRQHLRDAPGHRRSDPCHAALVEPHAAGHAELFAHVAFAHRPDLEARRERFVRHDDVGVDHSRGGRLLPLLLIATGSEHRGENQHQNQEMRTLHREFPELR